MVFCRYISSEVNSRHFSKIFIQFIKSITSSQVGDATSILQERFPMPRYIVTEYEGSQVGVFLYLYLFIYFNDWKFVLVTDLLDCCCKRVRKVEEGLMLDFSLLAHENRNAFRESSVTGVSETVVMQWLHVVGNSWANDVAKIFLTCQMKKWRRALCFTTILNSPCQFSCN